MSQELNDLHFLIDLHVAIASAHASVEQLVKVDAALVALDTHFKEVLFQLAIVVVVLMETEVGVDVTCFTQFSEELWQLTFFDLLALKLLLSVLLPHF